MARTKLERKAVPVSNVRNLAHERQRRAARRMAMQTIVLQQSYPFLFRFVRYV
jgi:hypothetical protein